MAHIKQIFEQKFDHVLVALLMQSKQHLHTI